MSDVAGPLVPYSQYLRDQLRAHTEYEYINPALDRRYEPVVVCGNAMHPVIQRGDVILIDTGNTAPENGRAVAVHVGGNRTVIGYWHSREDAHILTQERTDAVIDLGRYAEWSIYGVVTKIIGRGIPPRPPEIASGPEEARMADVSPGQAQYVMDRLIAERRVSHADIQQYLREMQAEIADLEQRIASLRAHAPAESVPAAATAQRAPRKRGGGQKGHLRGIAGTFAVLTRALPAAERARYEALRAKDGLKVAVAALRKAAT
jgi:hypothetical protein